ncbi:hypothetical protein PIB30_055948 [Stylosanthes scabra]|uniref:Uncharacterized protein n=1 Tax=Stylosanthes scabra TaxID=79078 RepID=A0ABU6YJR3_9FABA|nr:hypothetical protein [Stylosanthes scabra]
MMQKLLTTNSLYNLICPVGEGLMISAMDYLLCDTIFIGVEKSIRKAKKNIGSKDGLEKACKSRDFTKKEECEAEKRSYSYRIGANLDSLER